MDDYDIAIEIKCGSNGSSIREGLGQSLCYSNCYDYVVYLFIDTSSDKHIRDSLSLTDGKELSIVDELWANHNVLFSVV